MKYFVLACSLFLVLCSCGTTNKYRVVFSDDVKTLSNEKIYLQVSIDSLTIYNEEIHPGLLLNCHLLNNTGQDIIVDCWKWSDRDLEKLDTTYGKRALELYSMWNNHWHIIPTVKLDIHVGKNTYVTYMQFTSYNINYSYEESLARDVEYMIKYRYYENGESRIMYQVLRNNRRCRAILRGFVFAEPDYLKISERKKRKLIEAIAHGSFDISYAQANYLPFSVVRQY